VRRHAIRQARTAREWDRENGRYQTDPGVTQYRTGQCQEAQRFLHKAKQLLRQAARERKQ
jgi:hypothetical protein